MGALKVSGCSSELRSLRQGVDRVKKPDDYSWQC